MKLVKLLTQLTKPELEELRDYLNLTEDETIVFDLIAKGKSIVYISDRCGMSESTVSNRIKAIKNKVARLERSVVRDELFG